MASRAQILANLGRSLDGDQNKESRRASAARRMKSPPDNLIPQRGQDNANTNVLVRQFIDWAEDAAATTHRIGQMSDVPQAVAAYLARHNLASRIKASPDELLDAIDFSVNPALTVNRGAADADDETSLTAAFGGIAETGTLALLSGEKSPSALNFLPPTNIVVLPVNRISGNYEATWRQLRDQMGDEMPRTINWITGPSRTGDIEQTLQLGIHGPKRLHIILVDG
jgi:L-lactate dehydrogenase complex protein LldG